MDYQYAWSENPGYFMCVQQTALACTRNHCVTSLPTACLRAKWECAAFLWTGKCSFFIDMWFPFNGKNFLFKLITCSIFDHSWSYLNPTSLVSFGKLWYKLLLQLPIPLRSGLTAYRRDIFQETLFHFLQSTAKPSNFLLLAVIIVKLCSISKVSHLHGYGFCDQKPQDLMRDNFWVLLIVIIVPNSPLPPHLYNHWNLNKSVRKTSWEQHDKLVHI